MAREITIENNGPIESFTFGVPDTGGVVVLRGPNGVGKSTLLNAVQALATGERGLLNTRDGAVGARVSGLGAVVAVGLTRRAASSGECDVVTLDGPDPSLLVDPGLKGEEPANSARVVALARLAGAEAKREPFDEALGGRDVSDRVVPANVWSMSILPDMAGAVKRACDKEALRAEREAESLQIAAKGLSDGASGVPERESIDSKALHADAEEVARMLGEERQRQRSVETLRASAERAAKRIADMGDRGTSAACAAIQERYETARAVTEKAAGIVDGADESVRILRERLQQAELEAAAARTALTGAQAGERAARLELQRAAEDNKLRVELKRDAQAAADAADVNPEVFAELEARRDEIQTKLARAEVVRNALAQRETARQKATAAGEALALAESMRRAAAQCESVITQALAAVCPEGMHIHNGWLCVATDRSEHERFDALSHGERWRWALDIAANAVARKAIGTQGLLVCRQEGWESLDPKTKRYVHERARELGLVILTAHNADGELRAEAFG